MPIFMLGFFVLVQSLLDWSLEFWVVWNTSSTYTVLHKIIMHSIVFMKSKFNSIGHPWFACAHFSTFFTPVVLAYVVDKVAALIDGKTKVKRHEWNSWRVYAGLIPGVNLIVIGYIIVKMHRPRQDRLYISREYFKLAKKEVDDEVEESAELNGEGQAIKEMAKKFKDYQNEYSFYAREYFYIYCLKAFAGALPQFILQLAFTFRRGFCSDMFILNSFGNLISFTMASVNVFYFLSKKYDDAFAHAIDKIVVLRYLQS